MHDLSAGSFCRHSRPEPWVLPYNVSRILSTASFWIPEYMCESAWIEHAPFAFWLVNALRPRQIVELGTMYGYSYFSFCQAVQKLGCDTSSYAIDTWTGDEHTRFYDNSVYEAVQKHNQARYSGFSTLIRSTFTDGLAYFSDGSVDLLHIDGRHFYEDVKQDFLQWAPKLAPNAIVLLHDTNVRERNFGVWRFFKELSAERPTFEFYHGHGLGVVATGVVPEALEPLFSAGPESSGAIRNLHAALGQALSTRRASIEATEALAQVNAQLRQVQEETDELGRKHAVSLENSSREIAAQAQEIAAQAQEIAALRSALVHTERRTTADSEALKTQLAIIENDTIWRATKSLRRVASLVPLPIRRRLRQMAKAGYWMITPHKIPARIAFIRHRNKMQKQFPVALVDQSPGATPAHDVSVGSIIREHHLQWASLPVFSDRGAEPTLTIVTDSLQAFQLFGGVGTSLVVGAFAAREMNARLRIVTRDAAPDPAALSGILHAHKVRFEGPVDFVHMPPGDSRPLPIGTADLFLTTSWWSTCAVLGSVDPRQVLYLMQEDERMFYPNSDIRLLCSETISRLDLRVIVNTRLLFDHLANGPDALPGLRERGFWFDPAFPAFPRSGLTMIRKRKKKNFLFYARPDHPRNLYWLGLEVVDAAIRDGILSPSEWNIHFIGSELPDMRFTDDVCPKVWGTLPWARYTELLSEIDLGLSLMDTPHPSYPPIDLAAAGAIVVTNTHGPKVSLKDWSHNIICASPTVGGLSDALRQGAVLAQDTAYRVANVAADHVQRDWDAQLCPVMDWFLAGREP